MFHGIFLICCDYRLRNVLKRNYAFFHANIVETGASRVFSGYLPVISE